MRASAGTVSLAGAVAMAMALALSSGCSSDEFGDVGSGLPTDVSQDSLLVPVDAILPAEFVPVAFDQQTPEEKQFLYMGDRPGTGWRATPMFRFDFSGALDENPDFDPDAPLKPDETELLIRMFVSDAAKGILRTVDLVELQSPLTEADVDRPLSELLGTVVATEVFDASISDVFSVPIDTSVVRRWISEGADVSLAMVSRDEEFPSEEWPELRNTFVTFAGKDILVSSFDSRFSRTGIDDSEDIGRQARPQIKTQEDAGGTPNSLNLRPILDLTHFEVPPGFEVMPGATPPVPRLEAHRKATRAFLRFDPTVAGIPDNATINNARLTLTVRTDLSVGRDAVVTSTTITGDENGNGVCDPEEDECEQTVFSEYEQSGVTLRAYTGTLAQADVEDPTDLEFILRGTSSAEAFPTDDGDEPTVTVDVTDFLQRFVNGVFDDAATEAGTVGVVLVLDNEAIQFSSIPFYDVDAPDSLRPRLDVSFTPPADFWR